MPSGQMVSDWMVQRRNAGANYVDIANEYTVLTGREATPGGVRKRIRDHRKRCENNSSYRSLGYKSATAQKSLAAPRPEPEAFVALLDDIDARPNEALRAAAKRYKDRA
jgi:hypothetical protein